jgi:Fe-S-cluster-containing hydrogenase component 2
MGAIVEEDGSYKVFSDRCIGCGVCTVTCPTESITMRARLEKMEPPADLLEWNAKRAASRGIELKD